MISVMVVDDHNANDGDVCYLKVRLGSKEEHREWDAREELKPMLERAVKLVLRKEDQLELGDSLDSEAFIFALLCEDAVIKALKGRDILKGKWQR